MYPRFVCPPLPLAAVSVSHVVLLSSNLILHLMALSLSPPFVLKHQTYNDSPDIHGILVQLPLPDHLDQKTILAAIDVEKDVDGFHPMVGGKMDGMLVWHGVV